MTLDEYVDEIKRMQAMYNSGHFTRAEELRDELAEKLDDIMRQPEGI
jgi:hypothetical protein